MPNDLQTKSDSEQVDEKKPAILQPGIKRILWGGSGLLVVLLVFTFALPAGRILFFTGSLLSLVTLVVIAMQSLIYSRQWKAMAEGLAIERAKTDPRLRISEVKAENFTARKRPVFIVTIANDGLIAATGVQVHMGVEIDANKELDWIHDPVVTIPASGKEQFFIRSSSWLEQQHIDGFNNAVALKVVGYFDYWPVGRKEFCYRYLPWDGEDRPPGIPQFVPCDFEPRLNTTLRIQGVEMKTTVGNVTLTVGKTPPEEAPPQEEPEPESKDGEDHPN